MFPFQEGPWGGANQFLKAVKEYFSEAGVYVSDPLDADVVIFNFSPQAFYLTYKFLYKLKKRKPEIALIGRIDGPVYLIRGRELFVDKLFFKFADKVCDGIIFQSNWSRSKCKHYGMKYNGLETTIINAPDSRYFYPKDRGACRSKPIIVATSWSANVNKGFDVYKWMDSHLDFNKYEMLFVGNSQVQFENIKHLKPMDSESLGEQLRDADLYITASKNDPCSNSLIEALSCGLPAIGLNDGGHPEIINKGGEVFEDVAELPTKLAKIFDNYQQYVNEISLPNLMAVGGQYHEFCNQVSDNKSKAPRKYTFGTLVEIQVKKSMFSVWNKLQKISLA